MSTLLSVPAIWRTEKTVAVSGHTRHRYKPSPISSGFKAPAANATLVFGPSALAASIARTSTLRDAPPEMLARWGDSALTQVEWLVEDGATFALSQHIQALADAERTSFAGRVGAGVTDLLMNALGFTWRDNASCLSRSLAPHADFIYADGAVSGHGVVLTEAHGSFAASVSSAGVTREAKRKYLRQVRPHLAAASPHGKVIHGYSIAFGSRPGAEGAFLHVAETLISKPRGPRRPLGQTVPPPRPEAAPTSLALAAHRSNFAIMDAPGIVRWIDWVRGGGERPDESEPSLFVRVPYAGRVFLCSMEMGWPFGTYPEWLDEFWHPRWWPPVLRARGVPRGKDDFAGWFAMEEKAAAGFLNALSAIIRNGRDNLPESLELPSLDPAGFGFGDDAVDLRSPASEYRYALYRDELALLGSPPPRRMACVNLRRFSTLAMKRGRRSCWEQALRFHRACRWPTRASSALRGAIMLSASAERPCPSRSRRLNGWHGWASSRGSSAIQRSYLRTSRPP